MILSGISISSQLEIILIDFGREIEDRSRYFNTELKSIDIDSLDFVELLMIVEKKFNIIITNKEATECNTLNDLVKLIESKLI